MAAARSHSETKISEKHQPFHHHQHSGVDPNITTTNTHISGSPTIANNATISSNKKEDAIRDKTCSKFTTQGHTNDPEKDIVIPKHTSK